MDLIKGKLNTSDIAYGNITPVDDIPSVDITTLNRLPTAEDYQKAESQYIEAYWELNQRWSAPQYLCPKCQKGGMRKDQHIVLTSNPPQFIYECDNCHYTTYHHI